MALQHWFVAAECGDFRVERTGDSCLLTVEQATAADVRRLVRFFNALKRMDILPAHQAPVLPGASLSLALPAPMESIGPVLAGATRTRGKGAPATWTAIRMENATLTVDDGVPADMPGAAVAAVTLAAPKRGCPPPSAAARRASQVLRTFLTTSQWPSYLRHGWLHAYGNATGKAYAVYHRDEAAARGLPRCVIEFDTGRPICAWDDAVPAEEELLGLTLAVQHREAWLRRLAHAE